MRTLIAASVILLATACSSTQKTHRDGPPVGRFEKIPFVGKYTAERTQLDNGLTLIVVTDRSSPTFAYQTWFKVGSSDETPGYTGLAHLFEHMMFKGTKTIKDGDFDRILESAGAEGNNAFTSRDYTAYVLELPKSQLDLIARVEADRMVNLVVDDKAFKTEREVVQNERRYRSENSPDGLMYQEIFGLAFTQHAYRWPIIGLETDLERMSATDARNFYSTHYAPNFATVIIVGDVEPEEALTVVKRHYSHLPASPARVSEGSASNARGPAVEPPQTAPRRKTLKLNVQVEKLMLAYHTPEATHADAAALSVLASVLTGGNSSRLKRALIETGVASAIESYGADDRDPSIFILASDLQKGRKAAHAEAIILREIARIAKDGVSPQELERAKNTMNFSFYEGLESAMYKANFIGRFTVVAGRFEKALDIFQAAQRITVDDIKRVTSTYFDPKGRSIIIASPKKPIATSGAQP